MIKNDKDDVALVTVRRCSVLKTTGLPSSLSKRDSITSCYVFL